jgi:fatty-acyl-CoA synthase
VAKEGLKLDLGSVCAHLATRVAKWWIPERWAFVGEIPKTSVGKYDKKALRTMYAEGRIEELVEKT